MLKVKLIGIVSLIILGLGCQYMPDIDIIGNNHPFHPILTFHDDKQSENKPSISIIGVYTINKENSELLNEVWKIQPNTKNTFRDEIRYGKVPDGFTEIIKAKPLLVGVPYYFYVDGSICGGIGFIIKEEDDRFRLKYFPIGWPCPSRDRVPWPHPAM